MSIKKSSKKYVNPSGSGGHNSFNGGSRNTSFVSDARMSTSMYDKKLWQRPQTANLSKGNMSRTNIFSNDKSEDKFSSDLVQRTDKIFCGNPIKALKHRRMNQFTVEEQNILGETVSKPKNIINLIEEFSMKLRDQNVINYEDICSNDSLNSDHSAAEYENIVAVNINNTENQESIKYFTNKNEVPLTTSNDDVNFSFN